MGQLQSGTVEVIYVSEVAETPTESVAEAAAVAGRGLEGDRYFAGGGTFSENRKPGRDITLVEAEAIEALAREDGIELGPGETRRNVVTRGLALNDLVGRRFMVGDVECRGDRLCEPCTHLEKLTEPGVLKGLTHRGGLRADIVSSGLIAVGDPVRELGPAE
jgi:MOSC domain-containing protein YiiM